MSTQGMIGIIDNIGKVQGRYHHFDSYPEGLGKTLFELYHGFFKKDLKEMLNVLIEQHPAGWSNIVNTNFSLSPGFVNVPSLDKGNPKCYCHGDRCEKQLTLNKQDMTDLDYSYIFDLFNVTMIIFKYGKQLIITNLNGVEPQWNFI